MHHVDRTVRWRRYVDLCRRVADRVERERTGELSVHLDTWRPLAARRGRKLTEYHALEIQRNLGALLLELREADHERKP